MLALYHVRRKAGVRLSGQVELNNCRGIHYYRSISFMRWEGMEPQEVPEDYEGNLYL